MSAELLTVGGWLTPEGQKRLAQTERDRAQLIREVCEGIRSAKINRICARFELESDEMQTAEQKAAAMLEANPNL